MNICIIGKYFPIQGGVSKDNLWMAYVLVQAGFTVHVVTNAEEVEPQYRCLNWSPSPFSQQESTGTLMIHTSSKEARRHYIPYANPFVTKLAAIATDVITHYQCDLIYSYYLEPYALAAYLSSQWTGVPYGLRHAGSDVGSLFQSKELQTAYRNVICSADYVVATPATFRSFLHLGVAKEKLYLPSRYSLPTDFFSPNAALLDVNAFLVWIDEALPSERYYDVFRRFSHKRFDPSLPTIGIYGKIGQTKGSFDLLHALSHVCSKGERFNLLALTQGNFQILSDFAARIEEYALTDSTWLLPFIPHWDIPHFIRACTAVCFLERDFPIPIHTPLIPREVFACGTCLVLSHEVADKQAYRKTLQHGFNVFLVDPLDTDGLAETLHTVITDPAMSQQVGRNGYQDISVEIENFSAYAQGWPQLFTSIQHDIQQRKAVMSVAEMQTCLARLYTEDPYRKLFELAPEYVLQDYILTDEEKQALLSIDKKLLHYFATSLKMKQQEQLRSAYPATFHLPGTLIRRYVNRFYQLYPAKPHEDVLTRMGDFGEFMEQSLATNDDAPPYASEVAKYERLHYATTYLPLPQDAFTSLNEQQTAPSDLLVDSILFVSPGIHMEAFSYDIVQIVKDLHEQLPIESPHSGQHFFLFQREVHSLTTNVFALNPATVHLLSLCDGTRTIATIIQEVERQREATGLATDILTTLNTLSKNHILRSHSS